MSDGTLMLTTKQHQILELIVKGNPTPADGISSSIDLDELLERLPYKTSKDSMHFSIRALIRRELVVKGELERRRGRLRVTYVPTDTARKIFAPPAPEPIVEPEGVAELLSGLV